MAYKPTVLNISAAGFFVWVCAYTAINYKTLSAEEGWGVVAMIGLAGVCIAAGAADLILQQFIKNKVVLNVVEGAIVTVALVCMA